MALIAGGAALFSEARHICDSLRGRPHIFNLGHGILPQTPASHVADLIAAVRHLA
jgi:uroporphyrinogen decarboxylase